MSYLTYHRKYKFYIEWYMTLDKIDRNGIIGEWINRNVFYYRNIIVEMDKLINNNYRGT